MSAPVKLLPLLLRFEGTTKKKEFHDLCCCAARAESISNKCFDRCFMCSSEWQMVSVPPSALRAFRASLRLLCFTMEHKFSCKFLLIRCLMLKTFDKLGKFRLNKCRFIVN